MMEKMELFGVVRLWERDSNTIWKRKIKENKDK